MKDNGSEILLQLYDMTFKNKITHIYDNLFYGRYLLLYMNTQLEINIFVKLQKYACY